MSNSKKQRSQQRQKEKDTEIEAAIPLGRYLASTEKKVRDRAIRSLSKFLAQSNREPLSETDMAKLWKGIFYCFWMSDKPRVQQALAQELADLLLTIKAPTSSSSSPSKPGLLFLEGFFDAMIREWPGLDKWRIDKFYLLFRRFINAAFRLLARNGWQEEDTAQFTNSLTREGGPLCANDIKVPDGISYHLADVYVEELDKAVLAEEDVEVTTKGVPTLLLLQPFIVTMSICHSSLVYDRIYNAVLHPLLEDCLVKSLEDVSEAEKNGQKRKAVGAESTSKRQRRESDCQVESDDEEEEEAQTGYHFPALMAHLQGSAEKMRRDIFGAIFVSASRPESLETRRRRLYRLCKEEEERLEEQ